MKQRGRYDAADSPYASRPDRQHHPKETSQHKERLEIADANDFVATNAGRRGNFDNVAFGLTH
jgi:hypothetical protein